MQPTRAADPEADWRAVSRSPRRPYSVLLPVGFAMPSLLPRTRCALTAPFHPYPACKSEASRRMLRKSRHEAVCWRGGLLSVALSLGLPPPDVIRHRASMKPGLSSPPGYAKQEGGAAIRPADAGNKGPPSFAVKPGVARAVTSF